MKKFSTILVSLALIGALSACGGGQQKSAEPAPAAPAKENAGAASGGASGGTASAAEAKFSQTCAGCHGADLSGGVGPNLQHVGGKYSKDDIVGIITNGKGAMPPGLLQGDDLQSVATWLSEKK